MRMILQKRIRDEWEEREKKEKEAAEEKRKADDAQKEKQVTGDGRPLEYPVLFARIKSGFLTAIDLAVYVDSFGTYCRINMHLKVTAWRPFRMGDFCPSCRWCLGALQS